MNDTHFATLNAVLFEKEFLIEKYFISVNDGEYCKIAVKDPLPFDFCGHGGNYARSARFSIYAVTPDGNQSDAYEFYHGNFECLDNISLSVSASASDFASMGASLSAAEGPATPDGEDANPN